MCSCYWSIWRNWKGICSWGEKKWKTNEVIFLQLARQGLNVAIMSRSREKLEKVEKEISKCTVKSMIQIISISRIKVWSWSPCDTSWFQWRTKCLWWYTSRDIWSGYCYFRYTASLHTIIVIIIAVNNVGTGLRWPLYLHEIDPLVSWYLS